MINNDCRCPGCGECAASVRERTKSKPGNADTLSAAYATIQYEKGRDDMRDVIVKWLRTTPHARGVLLPVSVSQYIALLALAIENGEHEQ